jgi:hypothetical protein
MTAIEGWLSVPDQDEIHERLGHLERTRAELRAAHPGLTDVQIDMIAIVAADIRAVRSQITARFERTTLTS